VSTATIRGVADSFAKGAIRVIAHSLFDRIRRGIQLGYAPPERDQGMGSVQQLKAEDTFKDLAAALAVVKHSGRVGTVGYCWAGTLSYLPACDLPVACAVVYYGKVANHLDKKPKRPVMYHFGTQDKSIPFERYRKDQGGAPRGHALSIRRRRSRIQVCEQRPSYARRIARSARNAPSNSIARYIVGTEKQPD